MSHAYGEIIIDNKVVAHFEYNGTSDVSISNLRDTKQEVFDNWREAEWLECKCTAPSTKAIAYTDYGYGFHWDVLICLPCRAFVSGHSPEDDKRGHPICVSTAEHDWKENENNKHIYCARCSVAQCFWCKKEKQRGEQFINVMTFNDGHKEMHVACANEWRDNTD